MITEPKVKSSKGTQTLKPLTEVLDQSEHIKDMVEECAEDLSSVNTVLHQELADLYPLPDVENALEKSGAVESKVQEAAEELSAVNQALEYEVKEREMLEHQLAAVKGQEQAARHAAFHDSLTGLPNRVLFNDRLQHGLAQAKRHGWSMAVMFVDLDDFKSINDSYGHDVGDSVLQTIAQRLKENTREDDTVCRHGGDEFLYLLMEIRDEQAITMIVKKIIKAIQEPCDVSIRDLAISPSIGASIGISIFPKHGVTADALIKSADKAMYRAKRTGSGYAFAR
jgi:diguanylate cyclase (GGDEF)-like protein